MNLRQAAKMALDVLERLYDNGEVNVSRSFHEEVMDELAKALAEPEQEPVAWRYRGNLHEFDPSDWAEGPVTPLYTAPTPRKPLIPVVHGSALSPSEEKWYAAGWKAAEAAHGIGEQT